MTVATPKTAQQYTGAPRKVGPNTLQKERGLLKRMEVTPTIQTLKTMSLEDCLKYPAPPTMAPEAISLADQIYESNRVSHSTQESGPSISQFDAMIPPPVPHMPTTSKRKMAKKPKKVVVASTGLPPVDMSIRRRDSTPCIMEVSDDSDKVLDWGSSDEIMEFTREPGAIRVDNYYSDGDDRDGTGGVFDDHYDPRQVTFSPTNTIHANLYQQYNSHVAYNAKHVISVDTSKIHRNSLVNCIKCQKDKTAQFIADTGASNTFTFDKNDFVTFVKDDGTIQTADKKAVLQVQGYGTIFIKHNIMIKGKLCTVTSKLQLVYYAPEILY